MRLKHENKENQRCDIINLQQKTLFDVVCKDQKSSANKKRCNLLGDHHQTIYLQHASKPWLCLIYYVQGVP